MIYRNRKLMDLAKEVPHCMVVRCRAQNFGQIVPAHSNATRHGKGTGHKAHDVTAFVCNDCHDLIDGRAGRLSREEQSEMFLDALYFTVLWLLQSGKLVLA